MNELDKFIKQLFWKMIKSPDKIENVRNGDIKFNNGLTISAFKKKSGEEIKENKSLTLDNATFSKLNLFWANFDVVIPDTDKLIFYINTPYKQYVVPEFTDRHEYAEVLDTIDNSLQEFERRKLNEYNEHFTPETSNHNLLTVV